MNIANKYCIYLSTDVGTLEHTYCVPDEEIPFARQYSPCMVTSLEWDKDSTQLIIGDERGRGGWFHRILNSFWKDIPKALLVGEGRITGIIQHDSSTIFAKEDGILNFYEGNESENSTCDYFSTDLKKNSSLDHLVYNKDRKEVFGTGGKNNKFCLWDLENLENIFCARNPIAVDDSVVGITGCNSDIHLNICATIDGHVLLYDDRVNSKAVAFFYEDDTTFTCISSVGDKRECVVGTDEGDLFVVDFHQLKSSLKSFNLSNKPITKITSCLSSEQVIAAASGDHLWVYDMQQDKAIYEMIAKGLIGEVKMQVHDPLSKQVDKARNISKGDYENYGVSDEESTTTKKRKKNC